MRKAVLGMSAAALVAAAAWANDAANEDTKVAAVDTSAAAFTTLDTDSDGRLSALEAANNEQVAAGFTAADKDGDSYLSQEEFQAMGQAEAGSEPETQGEPQE